MNKRINVLRLQAGISRLEDDSRLVVINKEGKVIDPLIGLQKFADLIVQECMDRVSKWNTFIIEDDIIHHSNIADDINEDIRKHFGVG